jgi:hypothetical protein
MTCRDAYIRGFLTKVAQNLTPLEAAHGLPVPSSRRSLQMNEAQPPRKYPLANYAQRLAAGSKGQQKK